MVVALPTKKIDAFSDPDLVGCCLEAFAGGREAAGSRGRGWLWLWDAGRERIGERVLEGSRTRCGKGAMVELSWRLVLEDGSAGGGISNETYMLNFRDAQYIRADVGCGQHRDDPPRLITHFSN
jgi:hypothetical protein